MTTAREWVEIAKTRPELKIPPDTYSQQGLRATVDDNGWVHIYYSTPSSATELILPPDFANVLGRFLTATYSEDDRT